MDLIKELEKASYTQPGLSKKPVIDLDKAIEIVEKAEKFKISFGSLEYTIKEVKKLWVESDMEAYAKKKLGSYWENRYDKSKLSHACHMASIDNTRTEWQKIPYYLEKYCVKTN